MLFILGFIFIIGFGVPYYVLLRWFLEEDIQNETESRQYVPASTIDQTFVARSQMTFPHRVKA
jgi:hypothetical protein